MGNVVLNRACDRACSFCFAPNLKRAPAADAPGELDLGELQRLALSLRALGKSTVPLVGGEPTLHSRFSEAIELILGLGMGVRLFTHGRLPEDVVRFVEAQRPEAFLAVVNASASVRKDGTLPPDLEATLSRLGPRACLGVTVQSSKIPYENLLSLYDTLGLCRTLRLGLAQPVLDGHNQASPDYLQPGLGGFIAHLALAAARRRIRVDYDCGFVKCMFTSDELGRMTEAGVQPQSSCGAIPDVAAGGVAWPCYALSERFAERFEPNVSFAEIRGRLDRKLRGFRAAGLYDRCVSCEFFRDGSCTGGCLARVIPTLTPLRRTGTDSKGARR